MHHFKENKHISMSRRYNLHILNKCQIGLTIFLAPTQRNYWHASSIIFLHMIKLQYRCHTYIKCRKLRVPIMRLVIVWGGHFYGICMHLYMCMYITVDTCVYIRMCICISAVFNNLLLWPIHLSYEYLTQSALIVICF